MTRIWLIQLWLKQKKAIDDAKKKLMCTSEGSEFLEESKCLQYLESPFDDHKVDHRIFVVYESVASFPLYAIHYNVNPKPGQSKLFLLTFLII